ncbi:MAG TPA: class I SAM-dependent methyltransferase [Verrucomicrobiales bacterium]|nr:class I SAM-dependent methyltransferase [Verrucomicrobiales bacterium]
MSQTQQSFSDKWHKNRDLAFAETQREGSEMQNWILGRNGFHNFAAFKSHLAGKTRVLDAGCGNGRVTALLRAAAPPETTVVGIDLVAADVARENLSGESNMEFHAKDLLGDLGDLSTFDFIYCQEVLHHTADPRAAFLNLAGIVRKGGEIAIYVYKLKAPVREFSDDYVREQISKLGYDEAMEACREITRLGEALSKSDAIVKIPEVKILGIGAGAYPVQRFLYHYFLKCFWNDAFSFEDNAVINYDWYHPQLATRHSLPEVLEWFSAAGLRPVHQCVDEYGITVRGVRE